jgi:DtxR family transcriptional regulator, Mn-dependent transcriptional regulator
MGGAMNSATVPRSPSSSVENYLKALWESAETGVASTKEVADRLSVASASVTNMFVRLQEMGFVEYERYRGASLTERGRAEALRVVRRHRLIEAFLLDHLGYSWEDVHEEAERLEHAVSDRFTEHLAELLGHPEQDPHGDPIPAADGSMEPDDSFALAAAAAGQRVRIYRVGDEEAATLAFLEESGLVPGAVLTVREARALDGIVTVEDENGETRTLGGPLAGSVFVRGAPEG